LRDASLISAVVIIESPILHPASSLSGPALARETGFSRWSDDLLGLLEAAPQWARWPLYARPALPRWSHGAVTLLGDAAHPMLPFLAQGAAQAIEDAEALGRALAPGVATACAFAAYERARIERATRVQRASRRQGVYFHLGGPAAAARDFVISRLGGQGMLERNAWLYR
jgi:salicylate hydroxylase